MNPESAKKSRKSMLRTGISLIQPGKILIRGYPLVEMIGRKSFGDLVYLLFSGNLPAGNEGKMVEAILVSSCEHGLATPSTNAARSVTSGGVPLQAAVGAGIIGLGDFHGGAIEGCAKVLQAHIEDARQGTFEKVAEQIVEKHRAEGRRVLGYGHGIHAPEDPRKIRLFETAHKLRVAGDHMKLSEAIESSLKKILGKALPINVDGAIGAIISDLRIHWSFGKGFFLISRAAGLTAHVQEEQIREVPMRRVYTWDEVVYDGNVETEVF